MTGEVCGDIPSSPNSRISFTLMIARPDQFDDDPFDGDESLDEDFPLGDGTADTSAVVHCPYCGEPNDIALDPGSGASQDYVEDCQVCCRPWRVHVTYDAAGAGWVRVEAADE